MNYLILLVRRDSAIRDAPIPNSAIVEGSGTVVNTGNTRVVLPD
jgi:hypothetical protein